MQQTSARPVHAFLLGVMVLAVCFPQFARAQVVITRDLTLGSEGQDVAALQSYLEHEGYLISYLSTYYDNSTANAVARFQKAMGLSPVGNVGPQTRAALKNAKPHLLHSSQQLSSASHSSVYAVTSAVSAPNATSFARVLAIGSSGSDVILLQTLLKKIGFYTYPEITGYFGSATKSAVLAYQTSAHLEPVGSLGPKSRALLNSFLTAQKNAPVVATQSGSTHVMPDGSVMGGGSMNSTSNSGNSNSNSSSNNSSGGGGASSTGNNGGSNLSVNTTPFTPPDKKEPVITVTGPASVLAAGITSATISATTNENASCVYNTQQNTSYVSASAFSATGGTTHSTTVTGLQNSTSYTYYLQCKDPAVNIGLNTVSISVASPPVTPVDTTSPSTPSGVKVNVISQSKITLTWGASTDNVAVVTYKVFVNGSAVAVGQSTTLTFDHTGLTASTLYTYTIKAMDGAGNLSVASNPVSGTTLAAPDTTPPSVQITAPVNVLSAGTTQSTLTVATNEAAQCAYSRTANTAFASMTLLSSTGGTNHSSTLTGLQNGTSYTYYVKCKDTAGNTSGDASITFSVQTPVIVPPPTLDQQLPSVVSNFDINDWIATGIPIPGKYGVYEGAFRFVCNVAKLGQFDPIVYPGQAQAGHLHTFFGNTDITGFSTYASLRSSGDSSCQGGPLNRSAYWAPSMMREDGKVVIPANIGIYYKGVSPDFIDLPQGFAVTDPLPRGLRYIIDGSVPQVDAPYGRSTTPYWVCINPDNTNSGSYLSIADLLNQDPIGCKPGGTLYARGSSPPCWDGRLDSSDHRSHMAYPGYGDWGYAKCPDSHPHRIVQFSIFLAYMYDNPDELRSWYLSSDRPVGQPIKPSGATLHFDWFGAWDDTIKTTWEEFCIRQRGDGSGFNLCNGTMGKYPSTYTANQLPRLWDPPIPVTIYPDTSAPTAPGNVVATTLSSSQVSITWNAATDDRQVTGYQVFRNGQLITTAVTRNYTDTGLTPSTAYQYSIKATDLAGNLSPSSSVANATTFGSNVVSAVWSPSSSQVLDLAYSSGTATFANMAIGTPSTDRIVVVGVALDTGTVATITIGGVNATKAISASNGTGIWYANVSTGSTADVVVKINTGSFGNIGISVGTITGASGAPSFTQIYSPGAVREPYNISGAVPQAGVGIVFATGGYSGSLPNWVNAIGDSESHATTGNQVQVMMGHVSSPGQQTITLTGVPNGFNYNGTSIFLVAWPPSSSVSLGNNVTQLAAAAEQLEQLIAKLKSLLGM